MTVFEDFLELCGYAGRHPDFVQGSGGNVSAKDLERNRMYIKASGFALSKITGATGWVEYDLGSRELVEESSLRGSIETPLHFSLGKYVVHTHPVAVGVLVCDTEGRKKIRDLFAENTDLQVLYVEYAPPGKALEKAVNEEISRQKADIEKPLIIFLENHGLVVSAPLKDSAITLHAQVVETIQKKYPLLEPKPLPAEVYLTPDHVLYKNKSREADHYAEVVYGSVGKYGKLKVLSPAEVNSIKNREDEQYRLNMTGG